MSNHPDNHIYKLKWNSHIDSLQEIFQDFLQKGTFTDVTLQLKDGFLKAHKAMLSSCSSYFAKIFRECEKKQTSIIISDVSKEEMNSILKFIYSGEISLSEDEIQGVLSSAKLLEIRGLSDTSKSSDPFQREVGPRPFKLVSHNGCDSQLVNNGAFSASRKLATPRPRKRPASTGLQAVPRNSGSGGEEANLSLDNVMPEVVLNKTFRVPASSPTKRMRPNDPSSDLSKLDESVDSLRDVGSPFYPEVSLSDVPETDASQLESPLRVRKDLLGDSDLVTSTSPGSNDAIERSSSATTLSTLDEEVKKEGGENYPFNVLEDTTSGNGITAICPFCLKDCKRTAELRAHIRAHTGEKPFQCDICGAPFARSAHLKRHRRVHTGERPFECPRCGKTFSRQDKLKLHVDRHVFKDGGCVPIPKAEREAMAALKLQEEAASKITQQANVQNESPSELRSIAPKPQDNSPILPNVPNYVPFGEMNYLSLLSVPPRSMINADFSAAFIRSAVHEQTLRQIFQSATQAALPLQSIKPRALPSSTEGLVNYVQQIGDCTVKTVEGSK
ncbi:zinc finger and BTB domain-containing protein 14-like [Artemia franciscana]|uniref:Uncharacterized protein n=1 Tax=Artemia franciscana TaxID=6661 RepID=A0AA88IGM7_ARTSF|nr:hypothetical protein QYM36_004386 [Artemia franciscana]KAK2720484.1 hypothetical protein QYM36_004386 [Artemia franciscana]